MRLRQLAIPVLVAGVLLHLGGSPAAADQHSACRHGGGTPMPLGTTQTPGDLPGGSPDHECAPTNSDACAPCGINTPVHVAVVVLRVTSPVPREPMIPIILRPESISRVPPSPPPKAR